MTFLIDHDDSTDPIPMIRVQQLTDSGFPFNHIWCKDRNELLVLQNYNADAFPRYYVFYFRFRPPSPSLRPGLRTAYQDSEYPIYISTLPQAPNRYGQSQMSF